MKRESYILTTNFRVLDKLRKQNDRLVRLFHGDGSKANHSTSLDNAERGFAPYHDDPDPEPEAYTETALTTAEQDRVDLLGLPSTGLPRTKQGHVKMKDGREVDTAGVDNPGMMALQEQMMSGKRANEQIE